MKQKEKAKEIDKLMKKYTIEEQKNIWYMMLELTDLYRKQYEPYDILGEIFNKLNMGNARTGQFFTPTHISEAIVKINNIDEKEIKEKGYMTVNEPACGAGGMILAIAGELQAKGYDTYRNIFVQCWDIDRKCAMMTFVQLSLYDIPAQVIWGDTLTLKPNEIFYTPAYFLFEQLKKERKLTVPLCDICGNEIKEIKKSELNPKLKICSQCYSTEQKILLMKKIMDGKLEDK